MAHIKFMRGQEALKLIQIRPTAFTLLALIALRARRTEEETFNELKIGQAYIGDYTSYGVTERIYRSDKEFLEKYKIATFKATNKGTIATLLCKKIFDINVEIKLTNNLTDERRTKDEQATTNKNDKNEKNEKAYASSSYLLNIPLDDVQEIQKEVNVTQQQVMSKGKELFDYCAAHGKKYKNYRAFLNNAIRRDFPKVTNSPLKGFI